MHIHRVDEHNLVILPWFPIPLFDIQLRENFGLAGTIYAQYLVRNYEYVKTSANSIRRELEVKFKVTQAERFWTAVIAANLTGGMIAQQEGLIDWDLIAINKWVEQLFAELRENATEEEIWGGFKKLMKKKGVEILEDN